MIEYGGLAGAKKAGEHGDRDTTVDWGDHAVWSDHSSGGLNVLQSFSKLLRLNAQAGRGPRQQTG